MSWFPSKARTDVKIPTIRIDEAVYRKILAYVSLCQDEISALGTAKITDDNILIDNIYLFDQVVSASSTDLSSEAISKFVYELIKEGKDPSTLKFWWHSHVNMEVFWSGTDTGTIERFNSGWLISMVSNKRGEFKVRLDMYEPFRMVFDDLPISIDYGKLPYDPSIKAEIDEKVKPMYPFIDAFRQQFNGHNYREDRRIREQFGNTSDPFMETGVDEVKYGGERRINSTKTLKMDEKPVVRDGKVIRGRDDPAPIPVPLPTRDENYIIPREDDQKTMVRDLAHEPVLKTDTLPKDASDKSKDEKYISLFGHRIRI